MIISTAWIKDYVDLPDIPPEVLARHITLAVCEVEQVLPDPWEEHEVLLEIDNKSLTHRPDLWGHYGMAREFATVFQRPLKPFNSRNLRGRVEEKREPGPVTVLIEPRSACLGFTGLSMDGIRITQSPDWMRRRLTVCGLRALNNITDISNYVMLETGMPLHIFDRARIRGDKIVVRLAGESCHLTTLDGVERGLASDDTLIYDAQGPISIAGVMGGFGSAVTSGTSRLFIEAANWDSVKIRRTSVRLGLRTEASLRYEKSLDTNQLETAILRAAELVMQLCPKARIRGNLAAIYPEPEKTPAPITITADHIRDTLGRKVEIQEITELLTALGFGVEENNETCLIRVPSFRATKDIQCRADIVEEIGRITGYDNIAPVPPQGPVKPVRRSPLKQLERDLKDFFVLRGGMFEIMTHPLTGEALLEKAVWPDLNPDLVLANPLSCDHDRMRPSLVPSMLEKAAINAKSRSRFRIMEIGRTYHPGESFAHETTRVCACVYDKNDSPLLALAGMLEEMLGFVGVDALLERPENEKSFSWPGHYPGQVLEIRGRDSMVGRLFTVHPGILARFGIRGHVAMADMDLAKLLKLASQREITYRTPSIFPSSDFDCTVVTGAKQHVADILLPIHRLKDQTPEVTNLMVVDVFDIDSEQKAVTLRLTLQGVHETMTGERISRITDEAVRLLAEAGFPLRQ